MSKHPSMSRSISEASSELSSQLEQNELEAKDGNKRNSAEFGDELSASDDQKEADFITGVWGVIYTVSREKQVPMAQVVFKLVLDCWQLLLLIINPTYGWNINGESAWWYVLSFVGLANFFRDRGLTFFLVCLYVFVFLLMMTAALCVWVAYSFKSNKFDHVWPITFLRWFSNIFFQMLDIASMTLFLIPMDCQYTASSPDVRYHNQEFPTIQCWTMPFLIHVVVSALSVLVFMLMATAFQMGDMETDPTTRNPLAMGHSKVEVIGFLTKFWLTACSVFITNLKWLSICYILGCILLVYLYVTWVPHYVAWVNHVRCASYGAVLYSAVVMAVMVWQTGVDPLDRDAITQWNNSCTIALLAGIIPAAMLAAGASSWRLRWLLGTVVNKFRFATPQLDLNLLHKFRDPREVEICLRTVRKWVVSETGAEVLDPQAMDLAETIVKVGVVQFKGQAYMHILYASFLVDVRKSLQSSLVQLSQAKKSQPSSLERFAIFSREQQQVQSDNHGSDLLSYVQMQRNFRLATKVYREALLAMSGFWNCLLKQEIQFEELLKSVKAVDAVVTNADAVYKDMLSNTVDNWRILRVYARFLEVVKSDPLGAAKWNKEASDMCLAEEEGQQNVFTGATKTVQSDERSAKIKAAFDDHRSAFIINSFGAITMANKAAFTLFGCKTSDLIGQNVKILMPNPFHDHHDTFLKNYIETGRPKILGKTTEVVAKHWDGHLFAVSVTVTKLSGSGMDSTFLGILQAIPDTSMARAWVLSDGMLLSVENSIVNWFGWDSQEMCGGSFLRYVKDPKSQEEILRMSREAIAARVATYEKHGNARADPTQQIVEEEQPEWTMDKVFITHKFLDDPVLCKIRITAGGSDTQHFLIFGVTRLSTAQPVMVTDAAGRVCHVCDATAEALGTSVQQIMAQGNLLAFMPEAVSQLHVAALMKPLGSSAPPFSCRSGLSVMLNVTTSMGTEMRPFQIKLKRKMQDDGSVLHVVSLNKRTMQQAVSERCLAVLVDMQGVVRRVSSPDAKLFGFSPCDVVGVGADKFIDVLSGAQGSTAEAGPVADILLPQLMEALVTRCVDKPGCSFRVGVQPPADTTTLQSFAAGIASRMRASAKQAAVMKVVLHCVNESLACLHDKMGEAASLETLYSREELSGVQSEIKDDFLVELQLWKADVITGVMQLSERGVITSAGSLPLFPAGLAFGTSEADMVRKHISAFLPLAGRPVADLFDKWNAVKPAAASKKGAMKAASNERDSLQTRKGPGVVNRLQTVHQTDGKELTLQVQAVVIRGQRPTITLIVHPHQPEMGMQHFAEWLANGPKVPASIFPMPGAAGLSLVRPASAGRLIVPAPALSTLRDVDEGSLAMSMRKKRLGVDKRSPGFLPPEQQAEALLLSEVQELREASFEDKGRESPHIPDLEVLLEDLAGGKGASPAPVPQTALQRQMSKDDRLMVWMQRDKGDEDASDGIPAHWQRQGSSGDMSDRPSAGSQGQGGFPEDPWANPTFKPSLELDQLSEMDASASTQSDNVDTEAAPAFGASEYKRAKRYKRLSRLLTGTAAKQVIDLFFWKAAATACFVVLVTIGCFTAAYILINQVTAMVAVLSHFGSAASSVANIAVETNYLIMLHTNTSAGPLWRAGLQGLSSPADIQGHLDKLSEHTQLFRTYHEGAFNYVQQLPSQGSAALETIHRLWEQPTLPVLARPPSLPSVDTAAVNATLWGAGQSILNKALVIWQLTPGFPSGIPNATASTTYDQWFDVHYVVTTSETVADAYMTCMSTLLQIMVDDAHKVNVIHYYFLAIEGCVCCVTALLVMLVITTQVLVYRWSILGIFVSLPTAVIRGLASRVIMLLGDATGDEPMAAEPEHARESGGDPPGLKYGALASEAGRGSVINLADRSALQDTSVLGILRSTLEPLRFWHRRAQVHAAPTHSTHSRRTLVRSNRMAAWFMLPFAVWGLLIVIINVIAHSQLATVDGSVALFSLINHNIVEFNTFHVFLQSLTMERDPQALAVHQRYLSSQLPLLMADYTAMVYSKGAVTINGTLPPHLVHVVDGLVETPEGKVLLFETSECLRVNKSSCIRPDHRLYGYSRHGLDALYNAYSEQLRFDLTNSSVDAWFNSPEFEFIDQLHPDMEGGLIQLRDSYNNMVVSVYRSVLRTHIIGLVLTLLLMLGFGCFMLWPFVASCKTEGNRIADLLTQLPPDIDVETLVRRALTTGSGASTNGGGSISTSGHGSSRQPDPSAKKELGSEQQTRQDSSVLSPHESSVFRPSRSAKPM